MAAELEFPGLAFEIEDYLDQTSEADLVDDVEALEHDHGRDLSFDWAALRIRFSGAGSPVVVSGQRALVESLTKALLTPRFRVPIYSGDYGAEFHTLVGQPVVVVLPEVARIITEVILDDPRVSAVESLRVFDKGEGRVGASFQVRDFTGSLVSVPEVVIAYGA